MVIFGNEREKKNSWPEKLFTKEARSSSLSLTTSSLSFPICKLKISIFHYTTSI